MHIMDKVLNEIYETLRDDYNINQRRSDFDFLSLPITNNSGEQDRDSYEPRLHQCIDILKDILGAHGKVDIVRFLGKLASIEPRIQDLQPKVRDHVIHEIHTFLIGAYIIEKIDMPRKVENQYDYSFMWKLCGPVHDLGYIYEISWNIERKFLDELNSILNETQSSSPRVSPQPFPEKLAILCNDQDANQLIQNRLTEWGLQINITDYYDWLRQSNKTDHGVIGALAELKIIDALYQEHNPKRLEADFVRNNLNYNEKNFKHDIVSAASAVFIHNIDLSYYGFYNKINFQIAPIAFLLYLCDTFQEWDRYANEDKKIYKGNLFDITCKGNVVSLRVPGEINAKVFKAINQRLEGLTIIVNGVVAAS